MQERAWGGPNSDEGSDTVVLLVYMYFVAGSQLGRSAELPHRAFSYGAFYLLAFFNPVSSLRVNTGWGPCSGQKILQRLTAEISQQDLEKMRELVIVNFQN